VRLAVLGVGLLGGSVGLAARARLGAHVRGWDPDPAALGAALARGALDAGARDAAAAVAGAELVVLAAPVPALPGAARAALAAAPADCAVTDVGSTKAGVVAAAGEDPRFVGGHPLAGAEAAGVEAAREDLFAGAPWYLTPTPTTEGMLLERVHRAVVGLGARPAVLEAEAHDRAMAAVSHLPHVVANVLVARAAATLGPGPSLAASGPSFRDATRVAGANPPLWGGIYAANRRALADQLDAALAELATIRDALRAGEDLEPWQAEAAARRRALLEAALAGGPVRELRVSVANRPGVVAELALALGRAGINISDMALAPSPDGTRGVVALWCAAERAEQAAELVRRLGHPVALP
jgi:prephenate dehydrogenase